MERPDKKYLTKSEFAQVYPEKYEYIISQPRVDNPDGRRNPTSGQIYRGRYLKCDCCGDVDWHPDSIFKDGCRDGLIRCIDCGNRKADITKGPEGKALSTKKRRETLGEERLRDIAKKRIESQIKNKTAWFSDEARAKSAETQRSTMGEKHNPFEDVICQRYGLVRAPHNSYFPDGTFHTKEIDILDWDKKLGIEIDEYDKHHHSEGHPQGCVVGYHKDKDDYFYNGWGIKILHLTLRNPNPVKRPGYNSMWEVIDAFLEGTLPDDMLIMTEDETYGDIVYS